MNRASAIFAAAAGVLAILGSASIAAAVVASGSSAPELSSDSALPTNTIPPSIPTLAPGVESNVVLGPESEELAVSDLASPTWISRVSRSSGIPERALAAYAGAALAAERTHPACGIGWNTIAAIGWVESEHGSLGGSSLKSNGTVVPTVVGVALNGDGVDAIADTDGGALDGDTLWDRAVGPLQFIPSTWRTMGRDGNGDGLIDVNNIDDAAYSAALHLCDVGGDLTTSGGWIAAVSAYNSSTEYNNRVADEAIRLAELS